MQGKAYAKMNLAKSELLHLSKALVMCVSTRICAHDILVHHSKEGTYFLANTICFSQTLLLKMKIRNRRDTRSKNIKEFVGIFMSQLYRCILIQFSSAVHYSWKCENVE